MDHPLKLFREMRGLSQDGLAQLIGTTKATISRLESGERWPSVAMMRRIATATEGKVPPSALVDFPRASRSSQQAVA
jgi:transcriptional regulator with XRE-family HTH domain